MLCYLTNLRLPVLQLLLYTVHIAMFHTKARKLRADSVKPEPAETKASKKLVKNKRSNDEECIDLREGFFTLKGDKDFAKIKLQNQKYYSNHILGRFMTYYYVYSLQRYRRVKNLHIMIYRSYLSKYI